MSLDSETPSGTRRKWLGLGLGVATAAVGAGAGLAWWQNAGGLVQPVANEQAVQALWNMSFDQPDGGSLQVSQFRGKPLLLNFWATWCPPCVKEMPLLDAFHREQGWQVFGLAVDQATPVREFLQRVPVSFAIALAGMEGVGLSRDLGNAGGQLPYTAVFDSNGRLIDRHLGAIDSNMLADWAKRIG
jgi:thiol-disulfide isomerase/thioredoxin